LKERTNINRSGKYRSRKLLLNSILFRKKNKQDVRVIAKIISVTSTYIISSANLFDRKSLDNPEIWAALYQAMIESSKKIKTKDSCPEWICLAVK
jgi:hypothetical protein